MPFKSKAQLAKFAELVKQGKMSQKTFHEWLAATESVKALPEKTAKPKTKVRVIK